MTAKSSDQPANDRHAPFGAQSSRSKGPVLFLALLYVCWFLFLLWMAASHSGR